MEQRKKKMPSQPDLLSTPYLPAVLKKLSAGWTIEYYVRHPERGELTRQRVKLNRYRKRYATIALFRVAANEMVNAINAKLAGIDPLTVMQHADHHDLAMTTRYANHADEHLIETIVRNAPEF